MGVTGSRKLLLEIVRSVGVKSLFKNVMEYKLEGY